MYYRRNRNLQIRNNYADIPVETLSYENESSIYFWIYI